MENEVMSEMKKAVAHPWGQYWIEEPVYLKGIDGETYKVLYYSHGHGDVHVKSVTHVEQGLCEWCEKNPATRGVGPGGPDGEEFQVCDGCSRDPWEEEEGESGGG